MKNLGAKIQGNGIIMNAKLDLGTVLKVFFLVFRGLFVTIHDLGHVRSVIANWPGNKIKVSMNAGLCCSYTTCD